MGKTQRQLSVVIPVYNEEESLRPLYDSLHPVCSGLGHDYEIIFVDDGSTDHSYEVLRRIAEKDSNVRVLRLKRNVGQTAALVVGFDHAAGEVVITLDADLQNDPNDIPRLLELIDQSYDVVSGWRKDRKDTFLDRRLPSLLANRLISWVTGLYLHDYGCSLKGYRREILSQFKLYGEMHRFVPALAAWVGARIAETEVGHFPRRHGRFKYSLSRTFKVLLDLITVKFFMQYSTKPNYVFGGLGLIATFIGFILLGISGYRVLVMKHLEATPLIFMTVVFFVAGVQLFLMGILAEMLIRIHHESVNKPTYYIRERVNFEEKG